MIDIKSLSIDEIISNEKLTPVTYPIQTFQDFDGSSKATYEEDADGTYKKWTYSTDGVETYFERGKNNVAEYSRTTEYDETNNLLYQEDSTGVKTKWENGKVLKYENGNYYIDGVKYIPQS